MKRPTVSVVIPTYNRAALLPRAIESVVAQSFTDWEIVVVDDGSTDATAHILDHYEGRLGGRFQHLRQNNSGSSAARNRGINLARGEFAAFLDSDDEFLPAKLEKQLALFALRPELGLVYCDYSFIDLNGGRHVSAWSEKFPLARAVTAQLVSSAMYACHRDFFTWLLRGYFVSTITGLVRREVLGNSVRFDERLRYAEEWLFYLQVAKRTGAGFIDEPLALHHATAGSLSRSDAHRNSLEMLKLLKVMRKTFTEPDAVQRRILNGHLARTYRQLAANAAAQKRHFTSLARTVQAHFFPSNHRVQESAYAVR